MGSSEYLQWLYGEIARKLDAAHASLAEAKRTAPTAAMAALSFVAQYAKEIEQRVESARVELEHLAEEHDHETR